VANESRAPENGDAPAIAALLAACEKADGLPRPTLAEITTWLDDVDAVQHSRLWFDDGRLVAYSDLAIWDGAAWLDLDVQPVLRGGALEDRLLAWNVARTASLRPERAVIRRTLAAADAPGLAATQRAGFVAVRHSYVMSIELGEAPAPPNPPTGVLLRRFRAGEEREVWAVHQDAFRDVAGHDRDVPFDEWHEDRIAHPSFEPALWTVAEADEGIVGVALCRIRNDHGWIGVVGVRRAWRGKGLGGALLRESFRLFWERDERRISLSVDADSPTGAVRLYEREGMRTESSSLLLERGV